MAHDCSAPQDDFELPIAGFQGSPEEIERQWFEQVYKGRGDSMLQLTWRAVLMGSVLGGVLSLTNLYIGLKPAGALGWPSPPASSPSPSGPRYTKSAWSRPK